MTKRDFIRQLTLLFSLEGFSRKGNHFYKEASSDILLVFGVHSSQYGGYGYLEYGYCLKSISKYLPYPKFNQLNLNCGRIMTEVGKALVYETLDKNTMNSLQKAIHEKIDLMGRLAASGGDRLIGFYLSEEHTESWYILGEKTAEYFRLPKDAFSGHFCEDS